MRTGWAVVAAAAVLGGMAGSAAAVRVSGYPGPPEQKAAVAAVQKVYGVAPAVRTGPTIRCEVWCPEPPAEGVASYDSPPDHTDVTQVILDETAGRALAERIRSQDGFSVRSVAERTDGLRLDPTTVPGRDVIAVSKEASAPAVMLAVTGLVIGAALGAFVALRLLRRPRNAVAAAVVSLMVAVSFAYAAIAVLLAVHNTTDRRWSAKDVQTAEFLLTTFPPATIIAVVAAALAAGLTLSRGISARPRQSVR